MGATRLEAAEKPTRDASGIFQQPRLAFGIEKGEENTDSTK